MEWSNLISTITLNIKPVTHHTQAEYANMHTNVPLSALPSFVSVLVNTQ